MYAATVSATVSAWLLIFSLDVVVGEGAAVLELLARKDEELLVRGDAWIFCLTSWIESEPSMMVLPVRVLTKICIEPPRRRTMLYWGWG